MIINMNTGINIKYNFTYRRIEYIALASMGFTNKKIAEILNVEETTVKKTFEELFAILGAVDRTSMVDNARELKVLDNEIKHRIADKYDIILPISHEERFAVSK